MGAVVAVPTSESLETLPAENEEEEEHRQRLLQLPSSRGDWMLLSLPDELLWHILEWVPIDSFGSLALVSPHWRHFSRTPQVYKRLCERSYLCQSKRKSLNVARFGGSYRQMLLNRPRVRLGLYVLKCIRVRPTERDMWTGMSIPTDFVETVYYRYLYFQQDGTVLYALTTKDPPQMIPKLQRRNLDGQQQQQQGRRRCDKSEDEKSIVWGRYQVQGKSVVVVAEQAWYMVRLNLTILAHQSIIWDRCGALSFDAHFSYKKTNASSSNNSNNNDKNAAMSGAFDFDLPIRHGLFVEYRVPMEVFRYHRDRRL